MKLQKIVLAFGVLLINTISQAQNPIGINIASVEDYSTELVFTNVFLQGREWVPYELWGAFNSGVNIPMGPNGYPLEIPYNDGTNPPQQVKTLIFTAFEGYYPNGNYRFIVEGSGQITLSGAASGTYTCPYNGMVTVDNTLGGILLEIDVSNVADPISDIKLILPGYENTYQTEIFNQDFLDFVSDFETIRFMDFMKTNSSEVVNWGDRTLKDNYIQSMPNGVSYEYLIKLCNQTNSNAWVCIPHQATDTYINEFATLLRDSLNSNLKIYVEYSNEVWNGIFSQSQYAEIMATSLGYTGQPWELGWKYYAKRTADVHTVFENVFVDDTRIVNVVASQMVGYVAGYILDRYNEVTYNPSQVQAEVLAVAPYFGGSLADNIGDQGLISSMTVDIMLDSLEFISLPQSFSEMAALKTVATNNNIEFTTYEGGQHLVTYSYNWDNNYVDLLSEVNRHPRMEDLYCQYFNHWYNTIGGDLFCAFSSHGINGYYGSWGIKEFMQDTLAPKYMGLKNCVFTNNGAYNSIEENTNQIDDHSFLVYPQPAINGEFSIRHTMINPTIFVYDAQGKLLDFDILQKEGIVLKIKNYKGIAFVRLVSDNDVISKTIILE